MFLFKRLFSTKTKYSPTEQLDSLNKLSTLVNNTPSTLEKQTLVRKFTICHSTLKRIYDPHLRHYLSAKVVLKYIESHPELAFSKPMSHNLDDLLDVLSSRAITGYTACEAVASFYTTYCKTQEHRNIFWRVIDRNLKMGVSVNTIRHQLSNEKSENLSKAPIISVALASSSPNKKKNPFNLTCDDWYASQKLDGIRCIAMVRPKQNDLNQHDIRFYSRTGRPFTSLHKVKIDIEKRLDSLAWKDEFVLDGEVCAYNTDDTDENEDFMKALSQVRRLNEEMENPVYQVFDRICLQSFLETKGDQLFSARQELLKKFMGDSCTPHLKLVKQTKLENMEQLSDMKAKSVQKGWEGLILRKDVPYEGKRT